jgi:plasmid stabilization system protein ParE
VPGKRLEYAVRSRRDLEAIEKYHLEVAGDAVADRIIDAIQSQAEKIAALGLMFRSGIRQGTRECVMTRYPYTLVYRIGPRRVEIARVIHQRAEYFQRGR